MNFEKILISEDITIFQAMQQLDKTAKKILFVVSGNILKGTVTDGDVRRWILSNGSLDVAVRNIANYNPKYIEENSKESPYDFMKRLQISAVPIVNDQHEIIDIYFDKNLNTIRTSTELSGVPVVIMAGGKGTRLYPYTKILPKPLIPIRDIPIIEHIMNEFHGYGCGEFFLIVNHKKNMIKAYLTETKLDYTVQYVDEDIPLGTGGGLSLLKGKIDSTFILSNCDILIKEDVAEIYRFHKENKNVITMVCATQKIVIPYGIVEVSNDGEIQAMREKPQLSFLTNTGCYIVEPFVIEEMEENAQIGFPDIIDKYKKQGNRVGVFPISDSAWLDMGQMDELKKMEVRLGQEM